MPSRKPPTNPLHRTRTVGVRLNEQEFGDLAKLAKLESQRRGEVVQEAALFRELAMPRVRELLANQPVAA